MTTVATSRLRNGSDSRCASRTLRSNAPASDNHPNAESLKAHFTADSLNFKQPKKIKKMGKRKSRLQPKD